MPDPDPSEFETIDAAPEPKETPGPLAIVHVSPAVKKGKKSLQAVEKTLSLPTDDTPPWFQLKGESDKSFKLFELYLYDGNKRSVSKLWKELRETPVMGRKAPLADYKLDALRKLCWENRWSDRCQAYDMSLLAESVQKKREDIAEYQGGLLSVLKKATIEMREIMDEPDLVKRAKRLKGVKGYMTQFLGHGGLRILLEGHKTLFGEKHFIDVKERTVDLKYRFIDIGE